MKNTISTTKQPIGLACDHAGFEIKEYIKSIFDESNVEYIDFGTFGTQSVDYPDFAHKLGIAIDSGECEFGVAVCGTGNGINMTVNKHPKVRSALCWNVEIARLAREHNNANILSLPARFITKEECCNMLEAFLNTKFEGGRHQNRIDRIPL